MPQRSDQGRSMTVTRGGIVAAESPLAAQAGAQALARGGSAVDAAIAANAVMGVVSPMMNGIGGDLFVIVYDAKANKLYGLNASGWAPKGLTPELLRKQGLKQMPQTGVFSITVPGAIASRVAAELYDARILKKSIEDDRQNFTRFFLLRRPKDSLRLPTNAAVGALWKTSLVFTTRNVPGALFRALAAFALRDVSLAKIESRPLRGRPWEYLFYLDFFGRIDSPEVRNALDHLAELADYLRILGCYPQGA